MMKFLFAFTLVAVASAGPFLKPTQITDEMLEIQQIIAAIHSPSTHPATVAALEAHLLDLLGIVPNPEPISVGPALVDSFEPISVGPALVDFEHSEDVLAPTPAVVGEASSPLVQIILNIKSGADASSVVTAPGVPDTVSVVDHEPVLPAPVLVDEAPQPVIVVEEVPHPVLVVDNGPTAPAITLPDILN